MEMLRLTPLQPSFRLPPSAYLITIIHHAVALRSRGSLYYRRVELSSIYHKKRLRVGLGLSLSVQWFHPCEREASYPGAAMSCDSKPKHLIVSS